MYIISVNAEELLEKFESQGEVESETGTDVGTFGDDKFHFDHQGLAPELYVNWGLIAHVLKWEKLLQNGSY